MLFTVCGVSFASSAIAIVPHDVRTVATYVLPASMVIFGACEYALLNRETVDACGGTEPPQATPPAAGVGEAVGVEETDGAAAGAEPPPVSSAAAANPPPPNATAMATA